MQLLLLLVAEHCYFWDKSKNIVKDPILFLLTTNINFGRIPIGFEYNKHVAVKNTGNLLSFEGTIAIARLLLLIPIRLALLPTKHNSWAKTLLLR
jgi:hypothetical protein